MLHVKSRYIVLDQKFDEKQQKKDKKMKESAFLKRIDSLEVESSNESESSLDEIKLEGH